MRAFEMRRKSAANLYGLSDGELAAVGTLRDAAIGRVREKVLEGAPYETEYEAYRAMTFAISSLHPAELAAVSVPYSATVRSSWRDDLADAAASFMFGTDGFGIGVGGDELGDWDEE